ncbi:LysR family transcriptional regulator [Halomonas huangheensis]|nr:LysR family transcriptional regulator [Halomonas huangheensis]
MIALSCFEAAARHSSVTQAAEELSLTQGAVSRQIRNLEDSLGCQLFRRVKQRLVLTDSGAQYARDIGPLLERLAAATREVQRDHARPLLVGAEPSFTTRWLLPRMESFASSYPDVEVEFANDLQQLYVTQEGFDVGILYGEGNWRDFESTLLMPCELVAVCTPALRERCGVVDDHRDLVRYPLLYHTPRASLSHLSSTWLWFNEVGMSDKQIAALSGQRFEHFQFVLDAALHGIGVAILPRYFVLQELTQGRLVEAASEPLLCGAYYVAVRHSRVGDSRVLAWIDWLMSVAEKSLPSHESQ